jgi:hypothetical protein
MGNQIGYENLTVSSTAVGFTATTVTRLARSAVIVVEDADVRWRSDGTAPTSSAGTLLREGSSFIVRGEANILNIQFIRAGSVDAAVHGAFFSDLNDPLTHAPIAQVTHGDVVHDAADDGNPVKIGGRALTGNPSGVANNDRVNAFWDEMGHLGIFISENGVSNRYAKVLNPADSEAVNTQGLKTLALVSEYDHPGSVYDRTRHHFEQSTTGITSAGAGTALDMTTTPMSKFALIVDRTAGSQNTVEIDLEISLDNSIFVKSTATVTSLAVDPNVAFADGEPAVFIRYNVVTVGSGNTLTVQLIAMR